MVEVTTKTRMNSARSSGAVHWSNFRSDGKKWRKGTESGLSSAEEINRRDDDGKQDEGKDHRPSDFILLGFSVVVLIVIVPHGVVFLRHKNKKGSGPHVKVWERET